MGADAREEWFTVSCLRGEECNGIRAVRRSVLVVGIEPAGQDLRTGVQPDDCDTRPGHRRASLLVLDDARGCADHVRFRRRECVEELRRLAPMHRVDAFAVAQLADGLAGRRLDVEIRIPPRPAEALREDLPGRRFAGAHQPGDDDVFDSPHRHRVAAYTRGMAVQTPIQPIEPPATIGILGGGQLGRMLGMAARAMGYRVAVLDPDPGCPAAAIADSVVDGGYDDVDAALRLADVSDVVTYELEHVAAAVVEAVETRVPVRPGRGPLLITQDRLAERRFVEDAGIAVAPWREVRSVADTRAAADTLGLPLRLKVLTGGYDGRGQIRVAVADDLEGAWERLGLEPGAVLLAERELAFRMELSVIVTRAGGEVATFPIGQNVHDAGVLVRTCVPAPASIRVTDDAAAIGTALAVAMDLQGTLTVELFLMPDDSLVVNELAPRVHNSGHWTIEGAATSQFEQHIRAICELGLGSTAAHGPAAMVNLLGTGPRREACLVGVAEALRDPAVHLHLYDKREVFERRKMGHLTAVGATMDQALAAADRAHAKLHWGNEPAQTEEDR